MEILLIIIGWIVLAVLVGNMGDSKTIGFTNSFLLSLIFSPLIGLLFVIASSSKNPFNITSTNFKKININPVVTKITDKAMIEYNKKEYGKAIVFLNQALTYDTNEKQTHFNLASLYSLTNEKEKSFIHLSKAVEYGYNGFAKIAASNDLKWLREQDDYNEFLKNGYKFNSTPSINYIDELKELGKLKEVGIISDIEFENQKKKILNNL